MTKPRFQCHASMRPHAAHVMSGEYAVPGYEPSHAAVVLDVGANVGAFAVWFAHVHPDAQIHCYEPHPRNVDLLRQNVAHMPSAVVVHPVAVFTEGRVALYEGANNCGEHSLWRGEEQTGSTVEVDAVPPTSLPPAEFLKLDTEGAELAILTGYPHLAVARAVALEWHSARDRLAIAAYLRGAGFDLVREYVRSQERGVQRWLRRTGQ